VNKQFPFPPEVVTEESVDKSTSLRDYIAFVWRHWIFVVSVTALALLFGALWLARAVPLYTATAQVMLDPLSDRAPVQSPTSPNVFFLDPAMIENQISLIKSDGLLRRVVEKNRLYSVATTSPAKEPEGGFGSLFSGIFGSPQPAPKPAVVDAKAEEEAAINGAVDGLRGALAVRRAGLGYILAISITDPDPERAAMLANAVADAYVVNKLDARLDSARRASGWLSERLVELREQLREAEEAVAEFRTENGLVRAGSSVTLNEQQLSELNGELLRARQDTEVKQTRVEFLEKSLQGNSRQNLPNIFQSPAMGSLQARLTDISAREADLLARYSARHPSVVNLQAEKRDVERAMAAEAQRQIDTIKTEYAIAQAREASTERALREATGQTGVDDRISVKLRELERTAAVNKTLFEEFLQKAKVTDNAASFEVRDARILFAAKAPVGPSFPNRNRVILMALLIGLGLGVAGAIGIEKLNAGFVTPRQVEDRLRLPVLGSIARLGEDERTIDGQLVSLANYLVRKPLSRYSESIRTLRTAIQMTDVDRPPKVIQVTSTRPGEGKTTIAIAIATSAAQAGQRVLLIDADLRHPSTSKFFGRDKSPGLVDVLAGSTDLRDVLSVDDVTRVIIIPAGGKTQNPPDLLGSEKMKSLVAALRKTFDLIIIDTPPVGPVSDPKLVSLLCDKTLYVVHWGTTAREMVETCIKQFPEPRQVAGVVLNMVNEHKAQRYGTYGAGYYYGQRYYGKYYAS
jgi:succinoglycan biosynthesis transport protein ExoP